MTDNSQEYQSFPIVGVVVSAKETEALEKFFSQVSEESNLTYVILNTSTLEAEALTPATLQHYTSVPVTLLTQNELIAPNHIYLIPPQYKANLTPSAIQLETITEEETLSPIDSFFYSLAQNKGSDAVAVILAASVAEGAIGIKAIKFQEGLVLVQQEDKVKNQQRPPSEILTGAIDTTLPPEEIPKVIEQYFARNKVRSEITQESVVATSQESLEEIFALLRSRIGHDFTGYKHNTLIRCINRRMNLHQINHYEEYTRFLRETTEEIKALFRECLIGITSFFRDASAFTALKQEVLPSMFNSLANGDTFRVWVPGCSTGEEVYSLAIILQEVIDGMNKHINLQLFGTDINQLAIERAREGVFPLSIKAEVSPERLERFFYLENNFYHVKQEIRNSIIFSIQDILKDPPFSRLNLLSCRNLLIYLDSEIQKTLFPIFHYTLKPYGVLMLGTSESIGDFQNLFYPLNHKCKLFQCRDIKSSHRQPIKFPTGSQLKKNSSASTKTTAPSENQATNLGKLVEQKVLEEFCPSAILIETNGGILNVQGRTGKFLELASGSPSNNVIDLARDSLKFELSSAIRAAILSNKSITRQQIPIKNDNQTELVTLIVKPLEKPQPLAGRLLVIFKVIASHLPVEEDEQNLPENIVLQQRDNRIAQLEKELQDTRESHQTTIEELESSNEELQATNEELESSNEELQATNEELESSKEELQSVNEELQTLNQELQNTVDELSVTQDDLKNLLNITEITTIIVDNQMRVKRFTPEATNIIPLIPTDIGRPIQNVTINLNYDGMLTDILEVLQTLNSKEKVVQTGEGIWYRMQITPYWKENQQVQGTVVKFINIHELKQKEEALEQAQALHQTLIDVNPNPLLLLNENLEVIAINQALKEKLTVKQVEESIITLLRKRLENNEPLDQIPMQLPESSETQDHVLVKTLVIPKPENPINYFLLSLSEV